MPVTIAAICFPVIFSLRKSTETSSDANITPTFVIGNAITLGSLPASSVFAVFAAAIAAPTIITEK